jgi:hypothetical protein
MTGRDGGISVNAWSAWIDHSSHRLRALLNGSEAPDRGPDNSLMDTERAPPKIANTLVAREEETTGA